MSTDTLSSLDIAVASTFFIKSERVPRSILLMLVHLACRYNTFCGYPPEIVKKMPKKDLAEEVTIVLFHLTVG